MLKSIARLALLLPLALATVSCATQLRTTTVAAYEGAFQAGGTIAVVPFRPELAESQEFAHYRPQVEQELQGMGYQVVSDPEAALQIAIISYGVDTAGNKMRFVVFGTPGVGSNVTRTGTQAISMINKRVFAMDIVDAASLKRGNPETLFKIQTTSEGSCPASTEFMAELIDVTFTGFPPASGENIVRKRTTESDC